jgi:pimeloyl-ACP methyl ester carboxylesterase
MADGATGIGAVNVQTFGTGPRRVVALHCSLGRAAGWAAVAKSLGEDVTVTAPDWPGHGKSAPWTGAGLMRETAVAIAADVVGEGPVDLVGHSYGAIIALDFATRHPEKVRTLTVIEPIFLAIAGQDDRPALDRYLVQMQPHFDALAEGQNEEAARIFMEIWGGGVSWDKLPEPARAALTAQIPVVDACKPGDETAPEELRVLEALNRLTMPLQIIYGDSTLPVVKLVMQGLQKRLPHAEMVQIAKAGHMLPLTHPQEVSARIRAVLDQA